MCIIIRNLYCIYVVTLLYSLSDYTCLYYNIDGISILLLLYLVAPLCLGIETKMEQQRGSPQFTLPLIVLVICCAFTEGGEENVCETPLSVSDCARGEGLYT